MTLWFFLKDTRKQLYKLMMKSSRLLLWSVLLFDFINCKRYFTDTKPDEDSLHVKTDHKILAELGDYEIPYRGDWWLYEMMSMRFCLTEAEESRLNHTVKNIKIRIKNIRIQIKNIALKKPTRDNKNLGEYAHLDELFYNINHTL